MKYFCIAIFALALGACACRAPVVPPADPPSLRQALQQQINVIESRDPSAPFAFCLRMPKAPTPIDPYVWVFASKANGPDVVSFDFAAALEEAGLLVRTVPWKRIAEPYQHEVGVWYRSTDTAEQYWKRYTVGEGQLCFGKRTAIIAEIGPAERETASEWKRIVHYDVTIADMPAFTQTDGFKKVIRNVPANGVTPMQETFYWRGGDNWVTPLGSYRPEEME